MLNKSLELPRCRQNLCELLMLGGSSSMNRDLYIHYKDSHYGMDDDTTYTIFWPWHI